MKSTSGTGEITALSQGVQYRRPILAACAVLCVLAAAFVAHAATLLQLTTEQMSSAATAIVRGTVTGSHAAQTGRTIYTHYTVQVAERWKGAPQTTVDVAIPGGSLNGLRQTYAGVPVLQNGKQYLLFLWTGSQGPTQTVGLAQGVFTVDGASGGKTTVWRQASGEMMLNSTGQPVRDQAITMQLSAMRSRVMAALGTAQ